MALFGRGLIGAKWLELLAPLAAEVNRRKVAAARNRRYGEG